jgi:hypothetical protein
MSCSEYPFLRSDRRESALQAGTPVREPGEKLRQRLVRQFQRGPVRTKETQEERVVFRLNSITWFLPINDRPSGSRKWDRTTR